MEIPEIIEIKPRPSREIYQDLGSPDPDTVSPEGEPNANAPTSSVPYFRDTHAGDRR